MVTPIREAESEAGRSCCVDEVCRRDLGISQFTFGGPTGALAVNRTRRLDVDVGVRLSRSVGHFRPGRLLQDIFRLSQCEKTC